MNLLLFYLSIIHDHFFQFTNGYNHVQDSTPSDACAHKHDVYMYTISLDKMLMRMTFLSLFRVASLAFRYNKKQSYCNDVGNDDHDHYNPIPTY